MKITHQTINIKFVGKLKFNRYKENKIFLKTMMALQKSLTSKSQRAIHHLNNYMIPYLSYNLYLTTAYHW